jgi:hypothetical protein
MQPELALRASGHLLIVILGLTLVALSLVSMWKERDACQTYDSCFIAGYG